MSAAQRMSSPAVTVRADTDFQSALALMQQRNLRRLPVVDGAGVLAGMVAERDLLLAAMRYLQSRVDVADIMQKDVVTVAPATPIQDAARLMLDHRIGGLPVVDGGKLVGVITETDIFRRFVELQT
jgi:acetoin utilization protein AcuB